jgi:hypothetical protein
MTNLDNAVNEEEVVNEDLRKEVQIDSHLKTLLVNYVGAQHNPENNEITVEMIVETMAKEFPEFLMAVAEENFIRGYRQAFADIDQHQKQQAEEESKKQEEAKKKKPKKKKKAKKEDVKNTD